MNRPTLDSYYLTMLQLVASRSTCRRRQVAAILTDEKGVLISTGYNGVPRGMPHCIDVPCAGATDASGDNARCLAIHAEQNCLLRAGDRLKEAYTLYVSTTPCFDCAKLIISAGIERVVAASAYTDTSGVDLLCQDGNLEVEVVDIHTHPIIVCLCGSTRFKSAFDEANYQETMAGHIVVSVGFFIHADHDEHVGCTSEQKTALDELHKRKIDLADEVLVLNVGGYIGYSTRSEIDYALAHNKPIRYLEETK